MPTLHEATAAEAHSIREGTSLHELYLVIAAIVAHQTYVCLHAVVMLELWTSRRAMKIRSGKEVSKDNCNFEKLYGAKNLSDADAES